MAAKQSSLTQALVQELLDYNVETGELKWKACRSTNVKPGTRFGSHCRLGYLRGKVNRENVAAHRIIWLYVHGEWPAGEIDHINGIRDDNRLANLRVVTRQQNNHNRRKSWAGSGFMGVYANHGRWRVAIGVNKKTVTIGNFGTREEAAAAYIEAKRRLHPTSTL